MKVGFLGLLGLMFIGLKLAEVITWSWWLVLLPLYAPIVIVLVIIILAFAFDDLLVNSFIRNHKQRKTKGE